MNRLLFIVLNYVSGSDMYRYINYDVEINV